MSARSYGDVLNEKGLFCNDSEIELRQNMNREPKNIHKPCYSSVSVNTSRKRWRRILNAKPTGTNPLGMKQYFLKLSHNNASQK